MMFKDWLGLLSEFCVQSSTCRHWKQWSHAKFHSMFHFIHTSFLQKAKLVIAKWSFVIACDLSVQWCPKHNRMLTFLLDHCLMNGQTANSAMPASLPTHWLCLCCLSQWKHNDWLSMPKTTILCLSNCTTVIHVTATSQLNCSPNANTVRWNSMICNSLSQQSCRSHWLWHCRRGCLSGDIIFGHKPKLLFNLSATHTEQLWAFSILHSRTMVSFTGLQWARPRQSTASASELPTFTSFFSHAHFLLAHTFWRSYYR